MNWMLVLCLVGGAVRALPAVAQDSPVFRQNLPNVVFPTDAAPLLTVDEPPEIRLNGSDAGENGDADPGTDIGNDAGSSTSDESADTEPQAGGDDEPVDLASRVRALEAEVASLTGDGAEEEDSLAFRLSSLEDTLAEFEGSGSKFVETLSRNSRRIFNGRIHLDTWQFPHASSGINAIEKGTFAIDPDNRTLVRRARLGVRGTVPPDNISYRLDMEFSGVDGGQIRDAWLGWDELPCLNTLRIGNQKRPYGLDHLNSSNFMTFLERPLVVDAFNRENRRVGIASYGSSHDHARNWQVGVFNMVTIQDNNQIVGDHAQIELAGRLANTVWYDEASNGRGYAHLGLAGSLAFPGGDDDENQAFFQTRPEARSGREWLDTGLIVGAESYQLCAIESVINVGSLQFTGEWMHILLQRESGFGPNLQLHGGYVSVSYFLTGEHIPWSRDIGILGRVKPHENFFCLDTCDGQRGRGLGAWQVAARFSHADFSDHDVLGGVGRSLTLALNWYMNANTRLQLNYLFGNIDNRRTTLLNGATPIVSGNYTIMGTRFVIDF